MITQRRFDELDLAAQNKDEERFDKWQAQFLGQRATRQQQAEMPVEPPDEQMFQETLPSEVLNA